jgi:hypothetical protein
MSGCLEDLIEVPLKECAAGSVDSPIRYRDVFALTSIELLAIPELVAKSRTYHEPVIGIYAEIAPVIEGVDVSAKEEPVVHPMLATCGEGADMRSLENGPDLLGRHGAAPTVYTQDDCLERSLAQALRCKTRIAVHRSQPVPGLAHVNVGACSEESPEQLLEVASLCVLGQVVALALNDIR